MSVLVSAAGTPTRHLQTMVLAFATEPPYLNLPPDKKEFGCSSEKKTRASTIILVL